MASGVPSGVVWVVSVAIFLSLFSAKDVVALYLSMLCRLGSLRSERLLSSVLLHLFLSSVDKDVVLAQFFAETCSFSTFLARLDVDETCSLGISLDLKVATAKCGTQMGPMTLVSFHNHNIANDLDNDLFETMIRTLLG